MKFEEALKPTLYNSHPYMPTKKETLVQKNKKRKKKNESISVGGATSAADVQGVPKSIEYSDEYGKRKKIVRRKFPKRVKIN